ncbi:MAG: TIGR02281 family clan AA aspartic protease [Sphingomicrobium sp.]
MLWLTLIVSSLAIRQLPMKQTFKMALAWVAIFAGAFVLFAFRGEFSSLWSRLRTEALGTSLAEGSVVRIPMAEDGHFWVSGSINGHDVRFLVDSGASSTTVSEEIAELVGLETGMRRVQVETANGTIVLKKSRADRLTIDGIERTDVGIDVNPADSTNVLGMNFLSSLSRWSVEGRWLVLVS